MRGTPLIFQVLTILFGFAFTTASCYSAGRILLARLRVNLFREETPLFAFVTGAACVSIMIFTLTAIGAAYRGVFLALGIALIALSFREKPIQRDSLPALPFFWKWLFMGVFVVYSVLYWSHAMGPEYSPDGSTYHLGYVARYLRQHGFGHITTSIFANFSEGLEMLFLLAFAFGRHSAAAMVHFAFFIALTLGMVAYSRRFDFPAAGVFGALLVYVSPVFGFDGTTAYNDVAAACVVFFVFYVLQIWAVRRENRLLILAGLLAGFAYGIKYTAGVVLIYALGFVLWKPRSLRPAALVGMTAAILIAPWMIKDWIVVDNPVSPLMNRWFPNPYVSVAFENQLMRQMTHVDGYTLAQRFLDTTWRSGRGGSILGGAFLLAPLALLSLRSGAGILLIPAIVMGVAGGAGMETRYLLPAVPFVALAMGFALQRAPRIMAAIIAVNAVLCWPTVVRQYADGALRVRHFLPKQALRIESEDSTLRFRLPGYSIARMIDRLTPANARIFCFGDPPEAYTSRELLIYYESTFNLAAMDILAIPSTADWQPTLRFTFAFDPEPLRAIRIRQLNNSVDQWSVAEVHLFNGTDELPRTPQWKLAATPNPFEVTDAFDGNPITRWRSRQALYSGMHIDVDFTKPQLISRIAVDTSPDQSVTRLRLEGQDPSGNWKTLSTESQESRISVTEDLRRTATRELRRRSITHVLLPPSFPGAADMEASPHAWGMRFLGEAEKTRLYALD